MAALEQNPALRLQTRTRIPSSRDRTCSYASSRQSFCLNKHVIAWFSIRRGLDARVTLDLIDRPTRLTYRIYTKRHQVFTRKYCYVTIDVSLSDRTACLLSRVGYRVIDFDTCLVVLSLVVYLMSFSARSNVLVHTAWSIACPPHV